MGPYELFALFAIHPQIPSVPSSQAQRVSGLSDTLTLQCPDATNQNVAADLEQHRLELYYHLRFRIVDLISKALDQLIPGIVVVLVVYFGIYRTAHELAGKETVAKFWLRLFADVKPDEIIAYVAALVAWIFGINAQRVRRNVTERLTRRIQELEARIDPNRTTSGLTTRGQTPPGGP